MMLLDELRSGVIAQLLLERRGPDHVREPQRDQTRPVSATERLDLGLTGRCVTEIHCAASLPKPDSKGSAKGPALPRRLGRVKHQVKPEHNHPGPFL
jgi:hypothetical protein